MTDTHRLLVTASRYFGEPSVIGNALSVIDAEHDGRVILRHGKCDPRTRVGRREAIPWDWAIKEMPAERQVHYLGGDWLAHLFATRLGWQIEAMAADWDAHPKAAGFIRNSAMIGPEVGGVAAFFASREDNRGTMDCATKAIRAGIATWCYCDRCALPQLAPCATHCRPEVIRAWEKKVGGTPAQETLGFGEPAA